MILPPRLYLTLLLLFTVCPAGLASQDQNQVQNQKVEQLVKKMQAIPLITGAFNQHRSIEGLAKPLLSSGSFIYWQDQGIYWQTDKPFSQAITYVKNKTITWRSPGIPAGIESNSNRDKHFRRILLSLFTFDVRQLQQQFNTHWQFSGQQWQLSLTPKDTITRYALDRAQLSGAEHIQRIDIISARGEQLTIDFLDIQPLSNSSHDMCVNQFGFRIDTCKQLVQTR